MTESKQYAFLITESKEINFLMTESKQYAFLTTESKEINFLMTESKWNNVLITASKWYNFLMTEFNFHNIPMPPQCLPPCLRSIRLTFHEQTWFEDFQAGHHGGHLGYQNGMILAILNLYIATMPPIKFQLNPTYSLGGDVFWRFSRWQIWWPSWILKQNDFSNSNSPCGPNASHQVWAQSDLGFRSRCGFKIFEDGRHGSHLR